MLNFVRGIDGYCAEVARKADINSMCISHGTVAKSFNQYDEIYKKIIAESVFSGDAKYFAIQTKNAEESLVTHKLKGEKINTGNLIFADAKRIKGKKYILFAVTMKNFLSFQFYGVEMYYEFLKNLEVFNDMAVKNNLKFLIKPHPLVNNCISDLQLLFPNLKFTKEKIDKVLEKSYATISFSSTVIEDSLCSKVPVILFDQWKRYKHCSSQDNPEISGEAVYYVCDRHNLLKAINSIRSDANINFDKFIYEGSVNTNIENLLSNKLKLA